MQRSEQLFTIHVGNEGTFAPTDSYVSSAGDIDLLFERLAQIDTTSINIYFHGGLVPEAAGVEVTSALIHARKLTPTIPTIFFIWKTGTSEIISQHLTRVAGTQLFHNLLRYANRKLTASNHTNTKGGSTDYEALGLDTTAELIESDIVQEAALKESFIEYKKTDTDPGTGTKGFGLYFFARKIAAVLIQVVKRIRAKRDHGLHATISEEILREFYIGDIGSWIWQKMKQKAKDMWSCEEHQPMIGAYFIEKLQTYCSTRSVQVNLIGHSAGSIVICHLMQAITSRQTAISVNRIAFLAPACSVQLFQDNIVQNAAFFKAFTLFILDDEAERNDCIVPVLYPLSLLYLVSGLFEEYEIPGDAPILGMHRFLTTDLLPVRHHATLRFIESPSNHLILANKPHALEKLRSSSQTHGGFDDDQDTIDTLNHLFIY